MSFRHILAALIASSALAGFGAPANAADLIPPSVTAAVRDGGRTPWEVKSDAARKPADVIAFSQIKPGARVVDLVPDTGYYTRILSVLVGAKGHVYALVPAGGGAGGRSGRIAQRQGKAPAMVPADGVTGCVLGCYDNAPPPYMLSVDPLLAIENVAEYRNIVTVLWESLATGDVALPEQVDAVFTAYGYNALRGREVKDMNALAKSVFLDLKPGGVFVVVDNAAAANSGFNDVATLGRADVAAVKKEILAAGFALDGESNILANAADDHTRAAADPALAGKPDQFLLRFKKPSNANAADKRPKGADPMANYYGNTFVFNAGAPGKYPGARVRHTFYNRDGTYEEMGFVGQGPGPLQEGTWFWDADGHNCQLHEFPLDERANVVCHAHVAHAIGKVELETPAGGGTPSKVVIVPGQVRPGETPYDQPGGAD